MRGFTLAIAIMAGGCADSGGSPSPSPSSYSASSSPTASTSTTKVAAVNVADSAPVVLTENRAVAGTPPKFQASPRPDAPEWTTAPECPVRDGMRPSKCSCKSVREWFLVDCGFGVDFWPASSPGPVSGDAFHNGMKGTFEFRARPGNELRYTTSGSGVHAKLFVAWPSDEPAPTIATLTQITPDNPAFLELSSPQPIPSMAAGAAPKPLPGDWAKGVQVNSAAEAERPRLCDVRVLRGWLRLRCAAPGSVPLLEPAEVLGVRDKDFYMVSQTNTLELTVRLEPGAVRTAKLWLNEIHADLKVDWPQGAEAPSEVSLAVVR